MKKSLTFIILLSTITSCVQVVFETPQPANSRPLNQIPLEFHGTYTMYVMGEREEIEIGTNYLITSPEDVGEREKGVISDSLVIKYMDNQLYINKRISSSAGSFWETYVLKDLGCGVFKGTMIVADDDDAIYQIQQGYETEYLETSESYKLLVVRPYESDLTKMLQSELAYSAFMEKKE